MSDMTLLHSHDEVSSVFFFLRVKQKQKQKIVRSLGTCWEATHERCICINFNQAMEITWWAIEGELVDDVIYCSAKGAIQMLIITISISISISVIFIVIITIIITVQHLFAVVCSTRQV